MQQPPTTAERTATARGLYNALFIVSAPREPLHAALAEQFARDALARVEPSAAPSELPALIDWAVARLSPFTREDYGSSWPVRLVREFAPQGLTDGAWLSAAPLRDGDRTWAELVREQLWLRVRGGSTHEPYAMRYAALLRSVGTPEQASSRWDFEDSPTCADISYEHALLGLSLAARPESFRAELAGFNLWMCTVGPCPLLTELLEPLQLRGFDTRYLEASERGRLRELALELARTTEASQRLQRGFMAAQLSYERWERAMRGANVPYSARDFVLEGIRRKARFAIDHHLEVQLKGHNLAQLFREGGRGHELLLEHLAETASLVRKGSPDKSPFMTHTLSLDGPMFDAFTAEEKNDLREWIAGLASPTPEPARPEPVALVGSYALPDELACSEDDAVAQAQALFTALDQALVSDAPARYSARAVAELLGPRTPLASAAALPPRPWLAGAVDVRCAGYEEFGWLQERYLSADWSRPATDALAAQPWWPLLERALIADARAFLPELLGLNLGSEYVARASEQALAWAHAAVLSFMERVQEGDAGAAALPWRRIWLGFQLPVLLSEGSPDRRALLVAVASQLAH